jgi:hypothetical protein
MSSINSLILVLASFFYSSYAHGDEVFVKKERGTVFGKFLKKDKARIYKYKRFGRVEFRDGACQTLTYSWELFNDKNMSLSVPEEACLALNPAEESYPNERALSDSYGFSKELIFDVDSASDVQKADYLSYLSELEKLFILEVKVNLMIPRLEKKRLSWIRRSRIKARLLRFLGSEQYKTRVGERSLLPVKGEITSARERLSLVKAQITSLMKEDGPLDCGAISHGSVLVKNYYPKNVYTPSSCSVERVEATLSCDDGVLTNSLEDASSFEEEIEACTLLSVEPSVEFAANLPTILNLGSQSFVEVFASASLDSREIVEIKWYVDGVLSDQNTSVLSLLPFKVGPLNISVVVTDSSGLEASKQMSLEVIPVKIRDFSKEYTADLDLVDGDSSKLLLSFSINGSERNNLYREFKKGGEGTGIPLEYDYTNRSYAVKFNDASGVVWMLQIDSLSSGFRYSDGKPDFYSILISPENAIIYRGEELVENLDGFTEGLSLIDGAAIYQVEL